MTAIKLPNLCGTCKENEVKPARRKRKFKQCESCRSDKAKKLLAARVGYRRLKNHINRLVSFYECGQRHGYLLQFNRHTACIQPIGPVGTRPPEAYADLADVMPCESAKYPTLLDFARYAGWKEGKMKPVLIMPPKPTTAAAVVASVVEGIVEGIVLGHRHTAPAPTPAVIQNGTLVTAEELGNTKPVYAGLDLAEKVDYTPGTLQEWDAASAVTMYERGMKVSDIADCFIPAPGNRDKGERIRLACKAAGVWKAKVTV
jgi:hypothetical protein